MGSICKEKAARTEKDIDTYVLDRDPNFPYIYYYVTYIDPAAKTVSLTAETESLTTHPAQVLVAVSAVD